jgi:diguanylate cyclase (GGDEF)-like protein
MIKFQGRILEMIARGETLGATAQRLCEDLGRLLPNLACSIVTLSPEGTLQTLAAAGLPQAYVDAVNGLPIGPAVGSCGTACFTGQEVVSADIACDPAWAGYRDHILPHGYRACWSRPIFAGKPDPVAALALYYRDPRPPTAEERRIVDACVDLCTIALERHWRVEEQLRRANTDELTGLANRAAFNAALEALDCEQGGWALFQIDLDNFKAVNDTFGHHAGDRVLCHAAHRFVAAAHPNRVFRIGGDEFAVIVDHPATLDALETAAGRLLGALAEPVEDVGDLVRPAATVGIATCTPGDCNATRVQQNADFALYHGKDIARGGVIRYWPGIGTRMTRRMNAVREVDSALRDGRLLAYYQPVIHLETGLITGLEALCRIKVGGQIHSAEAFHEATTDAQTACALTRAMVRQVAQDARQWLDRGLDFQRVGINVSSPDLHSAGFFDHLAETMSANGVPLSLIVLEITEAVYMDDDAGVVRNSVAALRRHGLKVALDDFGTGFASLTHLISVPVDYIKIDKSFVDRIVSHRPSQIIVEGVIGIASKLGIQVVAEGIETSAQAAKLAGMDCLLGQGYLFSPAVDAAGLASLVKAQAARHDQWERDRRTA